MWASIERNLKNGKQFKELPRIFLLQHDASHKLRLTRPNVAKTKEILSWTEWKKQDYFVFDKNAASKNFELLENYRKSTNGIIIDHGGDNQNYYVYDVEFKDFLENVLYNFKFVDGDSFCEPILEKLYNVIHTRKLDEKIDLCWVRYDKKETRTIKEDYTFAPPFYRGRDTKPNADGTYNYNGDRSTCDDRPHKIQVQVHYVKSKNLKELDFYSPAICIYIPEQYASRLVGAES